MNRETDVAGKQQGVGGPIRLGTPDMILCSLVGLFAIVIIFSLASHQFIVPVYAETTGYGQAPSVITDSTSNSPRSFYRGISESLAVGTAFGNPGIPTSNSYSRSLSDGIGISSSPQPPARIALPDSNTGGNQNNRSSSPYYSASANQRIEEKLSLRNLLGNKADTRNYGGTSTMTNSARGTDVVGTSGSESPLGSQLAQLLNFDTNTENTDDGSSSHSISISPQLLAKLNGIDESSGYNLRVSYYSNAAYGIYTVSIIGLAFRSSPAFYRIKSVIARSAFRINTKNAFGNRLSEPAVISNNLRIFDSVIFVSLLAVAIVVITLSFPQPAFAVDSNVAAEAYRSLSASIAGTQVNSVTPTTSGNSKTSSMSGLTVTTDGAVSGTITLRQSTTY